MIPVPKLPPPAVMLIHLLSALLLGWFFPLPLPFPLWMRIMGLVITLAGLALAGAAVREMLRAGTTLHPNHPAARLVTGGVFKYSRNPIYVGYVCAGAGIPMLLGIYWGPLLIPVVIDLFKRIVLEREEARLEQQFGEEYRAYKARVRQWL
jgi:protein-S-isoprenylcysteine O-methyltransferase Ste14